MKRKELEQKVEELERMVMALAEKLHEMEQKQNPTYFG